MGTKKIQIRIERPPEGGVLTYRSDTKYPFKGFPERETVTAVDGAKAVLMNGVKIFFRPHKIIKTTLYDSFRLIHRLYPDERMFCDSGRELLKVFNEFRASQLLTWIKTIVMMIWEFDSAYRFRGQEVLGFFNPYALNSKRELLRLMKIGKERELDPTLLSKWNMLKWIVRFSPGWVCRAICRGLVNVDMRKMKLNETDREYLGDKQYDFELLK